MSNHRILQAKQNRTIVAGPADVKPGDVPMYNLGIKDSVEPKNPLQKPKSSQRIQCYKNIYKNRINTKPTWGADGKSWEDTDTLEK